MFLEPDCRGHYLTVDTMQKPGHSAASSFTLCALLRDAEPRVGTRIAGTHADVAIRRSNTVGDM